VPMLDLEPAAREVTRLLDCVTDDQLAAPTPCAGTPVAALLDHFIGLSLTFTWAARKTAATEGRATRQDAGGRPPSTSTRTGAPSSPSGSPSWPTRGATRRPGRE
jgi:hypothetical protein